MVALVFAAIAGLYLFNESRTLCFKRHAAAVALIPFAGALAGIFSPASFYINANGARLDVIPFVGLVVGVVVARKLAARFAEKRAAAE